MEDIRTLLEEERWQEALARLDFMPVDLTATVREACDNERAWCLLQTGDLEAGLELAGKLCASRSAADAEATRAIGLVMANRPTEALDALEYAARVASTPRSRAIRWYYLGEARRALARPDAEAAYRHACEAEPRGPWAKRAEVHLSDGNAYR